jgi:hypothetical protein
MRCESERDDGGLTDGNVMGGDGWQGDDDSAEC